MTFVTEAAVRMAGRAGVPAPHRFLGVTTVNVSARVISRFRILMAADAVNPVGMTAEAFALIYGGYLPVARKPARVMRLGFISHRRHRGDPGYQKRRNERYKYCDLYFHVFHSKVYFCKAILRSPLITRFRHYACELDCRASGIIFERRRIYFAVAKPAPNSPLQRAHPRREASGERAPLSLIMLRH
jgi:hypothetical protein